MVTSDAVSFFALVTDSGDGVLRDFTYCFIPLSATSLRATCGCGQEYSDTPPYTCNMDKLKM